jgi:hypothetical protein
MLLDNVPDIAIMDAIEEHARNARMEFLAVHPECIDATVEIVKVERTPGHCEVEVKLHPKREPITLHNVKLNVTVEKKEDENT